MSRVANFLDSIAFTVSPKWGNSRLSARRHRQIVDSAWERYERESRARGFSIGGSGGFHSAERTRDQENWLTSKLSPASALEHDRPDMIERADSAYKNYELGTSFVEGRVTRVAGCGMSIDPDIEAGEGITEDQANTWNDLLRKNWDRQAEAIGKHGESLWEIQHLMQRYWDRRGEWFLLVGDQYNPLTPTTLVVEVIHPDRVSTPDGKLGDAMVRMGIQLDANGTAIGCYIRDTHPGDDKNLKQTWTYYPFKYSNGLPRVIHHFRRVDAGQHRGYPQMQVGLRRLKNSEDYDDAERDRLYVQSCLAAFVHSELPPDDLMTSQGVVSDADGKRVREINPGMIHYTGVSDNVTLSQPSGPPTAFGPYMEHEARMFAAGAGGSYEAIAGNWSGISYSGGRIIWNVEEGTVDVLQMGHAKTVLALYRHFVLRAAISGIVDIDQVALRGEPWTYWAARVIRPKRMSIDPAREDRNELVKIEAGVKPASDFVEKENGMPAEKVYARIKRDRANREEYGLEIHMPQMGRDQELMPDGEKPGGAPTQRGDKNQESSDANSERQAVGT